jgi:hypothetical protein
MATLDEGVSNLQRFCGLLTQVNTGLQQRTQEVENAAADVERLDGSLDDALASLAGALQEAQSQMESDADDAQAAVEGLGASVLALDEERLPPVEEDVDEAGSTFAQRTGEDGAALESASGELASAGFDALSSSLDSVEGSIQASAQDAEEAFATAASEVAAAQQQLEQGLNDTSAAAQEAAGALSGETVASLESDGASCAAAWTGELPQALESGCTGAAGAVEGAYGGFGEESLGAGDGLIERVLVVCEQAAAFVLDDGGSQVEQAGAAAAEQAMPDLQAELDAMEATFAGGADTCGRLDPLVGELEIAATVVAQVDELLAAVGG